MSKTIAIVHYRVGRTDGVSLEIEKRKQILELLGYKVKLISGPVQKRADFVIDELEFDGDEIVQIKENCFQYFPGEKKEIKELMQDIQYIANRIEEIFLDYNSKEKFSAILLHNIFSHGRHIAAASAFTRIARKLPVPFICTNHDYYWEREEYQQPVNQEIEDYLNEFVPPSTPNIQHICINSLARQTLLKKRNIDSIVFPDIFDFAQPKWKLDSYNKDFRTAFNIKENDIVVLQATRIVARKGIEIAVDFVAELEKQKCQLVGKTLYNGRKIDSASDIVLVLAGYTEASAITYLNNLQDYITGQGIKVRFIHKQIASKRSSGKDGKNYSLWDSYVNADIVTYPSLVEGWGNQFIEAVFAEKPIVLFEYPVFKSDIEQEGYFYISLGDKVINNKNHKELIQVEKNVLNKAVYEAMEVLTALDTEEKLHQNFIIGKEYHGYHRLSDFLKKAVEKKLPAS